MLSCTAPSMLCDWHSLGDSSEPLLLQQHLHSFYFPLLHSLFFSALMSSLGQQARVCQPWEQGGEQTYWGSLWARLCAGAQAHLSVLALTTG